MANCLSAILMQSMLVMTMVVILWSGSEGAPSTTCHRPPFRHAELDTSLCEQTMHNATTFRDIASLLDDANGPEVQKKEQQPEFIVHVIKWMYTYLHCTSEAKAILVLFYQHRFSDLPPQSSEWWQLAAKTFQDSPVGRQLRRQNGRDPFTQNENMLYNLLGRMVTDTHPSCIQYFINNYRYMASLWWMQNIHVVLPPLPTITITPVPTTTAPTTTITSTSTTTPTTTTTTTPTTTTTTPTTTTTTPITTTTTPTTTTPTPITTTTTPTTTTTTPTTTTTTPTTTTTTPPTTAATTRKTTPLITRKPPPASQCVVCGDPSTGEGCTPLDMVLTPIQQCPPDRPYCMTDIYQDRSSGVKYIKRCVDTISCVEDWYLGSSDKHQCVNYDPVIYPGDLSCHLCCHGDQCNRDILPQPGTYFKP